MHALIHLIATQPELLGDHVQAYGELLSDAAAKQARALKRRALLLALCICLLGVAAVLAGVAVLLTLGAGTTLPTPTWVWWLVPLTPAALALVCLLLDRHWGRDDDASLVELRRQLQADAALLRSVGQS